MLRGAWRSRVRRSGVVASALAAVIALVLPAGACGKPAQPVRIDLLSLLATADKRPPTKDLNVYAVRDVDVEGSREPAVTVPQPSRVMWTLKIARRATLSTRIGLLPNPAGRYDGDASFRIGVSGGRLYEKLFERLVNPRDVEADRVMIPVRVDLGAYAGWQWSIFYRPSEQSWTLVFSVDRPGSGCTPVWVQPTVSGIR